MDMRPPGTINEGAIPAQAVPMDDSQLLAVIRDNVNMAKEYLENDVAAQRAMAYELYYGAPMGDEVEGRSQVIAHEVAQAIDSLLPTMMELFVAGDRIIQCEPRQAEDVDGAEQATDVCEYVFSIVNPGYLLIHDSIKDGILQKIGALKWHWEPNIQVSEEVYRGLVIEQLQMINSDPQAEIVQATQNADGFYDVRVRLKKNKGRIVIECIAPEELLLSPMATSQVVERMPFIGHAPMKTVSDLIEMGYPREVVENLQDGQDDLSNDEVEIARKNRTSTVINWLDKESTNADPSQRKFRYYELYLKVDFDGDGVSELRRVCVVGSTILYNEVCDHAPISIWSPKMMAHEVIGVSVADDVADQQILSTVLWRQMLDNMYLSNSPRIRVDTGMNAGYPTIDDLLTVRPGGLVRAKAGSVEPMDVPFVAGHTFQMLEFVKQEIEGRTGVGRYFQGLDPDSLNKTATGMNILNNASQTRVKVYSRNYAEMCLVPCFRGILKLLAQFQDEPMYGRLRNKFIATDPRAWKTEYDFTVNVGLGTGSKQEQLMLLQSIEQAQVMAVQSPMGPQLVDPQRIYNLQARKCVLAGQKDPNRYWIDPSTAPPQEPQPEPPDPTIVAAQIKAEADKETAGMKAQTDAANAEREAQLKREQAALEVETERYKAQLKAQTEIAVAQMKAAFEDERARLNDERDANIEALRIDAGVRTAVIGAGMPDPEEGLRQQKREDEARKGEEEGRRHSETQEALAGIKSLAEELSRRLGKRNIVRKDGKAVSIE